MTEDEYIRQGWPQLIEEELRKVERQKRLQEWESYPLALRRLVYQAVRADLKCQYGYLLDERNKRRDARNWTDDFLGRCLTVCMLVTARKEARNGVQKQETTNAES